MKHTKHYILLAALALAGYGSGIAYAMDNEVNEHQMEHQLLKQAKISIIEAIQKAQAAYPDMSVSAVDFEDEADTPAYSIELEGDNGEKEITISAETGEIIPEND